MASRANGRAILQYELKQAVLAAPPPPLPAAVSNARETTEFGNLN
jgi:hypothetical protein